MTADPQLIAARARSAAARAHFDASLATAKERLTPGALAGSAVDGVKTKAGEIARERLADAREHPAKTAAVVGAVGLALFARPLVGWFRSRGDATADDDVS